MGLRNFRTVFKRYDGYDALGSNDGVFAARTPTF